MAAGAGGGGSGGKLEGGVQSISHTNALTDWSFTDLLFQSCHEEVWVGKKPITSFCKKGLASLVGKREGSSLPEGCQVFSRRERGAVFWKGEGGKGQDLNRPHRNFIQFFFTTILTSGSFRPFMPLSFCIADDQLTTFHLGNPPCMSNATGNQESSMSVGWEGRLYWRLF